jgi:hypothetical protein
MAKLLVSDFFAPFQEQETHRHRGDAEQEHRDHPDSEIHLRLLSSNRGNGRNSPSTRGQHLSRRCSSTPGMKITFTDG